MRYSLDSFINNTLGLRVNELIIDGERSPIGKWLSLFGNQPELQFTNFYFGNHVAVGKRISIMPYTNGKLDGYEWKSARLDQNPRLVICRYHP
jgi:hypothetical protein